MTHKQPCWGVPALGRCWLGAGAAGAPIRDGGFTNSNCSASHTALICKETSWLWVEVRWVLLLAGLTWLYSLVLLTGFGAKLVDQECHPCCIIVTNQQIMVSLDAELSLHAVQPFNTPPLSASLQDSCTMNKWI